MSYLTELNSLVSEKRKEVAKTREPTEADYTGMYRQIAESLLRSSIWVKYDSYSEMDATFIAHPGDKFHVDMIARVDMREVPIVTVRSVSMFAMAREVCFNTTGWYLERSALIEDLRIRQSKVVMLAGLRHLDGDLHKYFPKGLVAECRVQHRCLIFPLEELAKRAGMTLMDIMPSSTLSKTRSSV